MPLCGNTAIACIANKYVSFISNERTQRKTRENRERQRISDIEKIPRLMNEYLITMEFVIYNIYHQESIEKYLSKYLPD